MRKTVHCTCSYEYLEILVQCPSCGRPTSENKKNTAKTTTTEVHNIPYPPKPQLFTTGNTAVFFVGLSLLIISCLVFTVTPDRPEFSDNPFSFFFWLAIGVIGGLMFIGVLVLYCLELHDYSQAINDYEGYVKRRTQKIEKNRKKYDARYNRTTEMQREQDQAEIERLKKLPECPICSKKDCVKRISTLNRSASIAAFGLASAKIGKQYQCERCKHLW